MSVNVFTQFVVGAMSLTLGVYLLRSREPDEKESIVPLVFVVSGWSIIVFSMDFNPYAVVAAVLIQFALFVKESSMFSEMTLILAVIGSLSFAKGILGNDTNNCSKLFMTFAATVFMGAYWMYDAPLWTAIVSWTLFALVVATPVQRQMTLDNSKLLLEPLKESLTIPETIRTWE